MEQERHFRERADNAADSARRMSVTLNTGGIGLIFTLGIATSKLTVGPMVIASTAIYLLAICATAASWMLVKHRYLKRARIMANAAASDTPVEGFSVPCMQPVFSGTAFPSHFSQWRPFC